jgi:hypothetical protein
VPGAKDEGAGCDTGRPLCGAPARYYAAGWRCDEHRPSKSAATAPPRKTPEETT